MTFFSTLFHRKPQDKSPFHPAVAEGVRLYAIGDIHGRLDLLQTLHAMIAADYARTQTAAKPLIVYLGDYIDRGANSRELIDYLLSNPLPEIEKIFLKGNHEAALLTFHENPEVAELWLTFGGQATLQSYGIPPLPMPLTPPKIAALQQEVRRRIPASHWHFYETLQLFYSHGDYLFVHAGINPSAPAAREENVLLWMREPFLSSKKKYPHIVVHGHTVAPSPQKKYSRIGIDTGAYATGKLTALVLEGTEQAFLQTNTGFE